MGDCGCIGIHTCTCMRSGLLANWKTIYMSVHTELCMHYILTTGKRCKTVCAWMSVCVWVCVSQRRGELARIMSLRLIREWEWSVFVEGVGRQGVWFTQTKINISGDIGVAVHLDWGWVGNRSWPGEPSVHGRQELGCLSRFFLAERSKVREIVTKSDNSDSRKNCGQAERRGNWTARPARVPTQCDAGAEKGRGDSRRDAVQGTKTWNTLKENSISPMTMG